MNIWAIVPVKPLNRAKSRLSPVLEPEQRQAFSQQMLERTIKTLQAVEAIKGILLVSRDSAALAVGRGLGAQTLTESGVPELNDSLTRATQAVKTWQANGVLVIASDIPLVTPDDLNTMLQLGRMPPSAVLAPDRRKDGTNAMLVRPPALFPYQFGPGSFERHRQSAEEAGATVKVYESETLSLDVDYPEDLDLYREKLAEFHSDESVWPTS